MRGCSTGLGSYRKAAVERNTDLRDNRRFTIFSPIVRYCSIGGVCSSYIGSTIRRHLGTVTVGLVDIG
jgi:hypothetical protein